MLLSHQTTLKGWEKEWNHLVLGLKHAAQDTVQAWKYVRLGAHALTLKGALVKANVLVFDLIALVYYFATVLQPVFSFSSPILFFGLVRIFSLLKCSTIAMFWLHQKVWTPFLSIANKKNITSLLDESLQWILLCSAPLTRAFSQKVIQIWSNSLIPDSSQHTRPFPVTMLTSFRLIVNNMPKNSLQIRSSRWPNWNITFIAGRGYRYLFPLTLYGEQTGF